MELSLRKLSFLSLVELTQLIAVPRIHLHHHLSVSQLIPQDTAQVPNFPETSPHSIPTNPYHIEISSIPPQGRALPSLPKLVLGKVMAIDFVTFSPPRTSQFSTVGPL